MSNSIAHQPATNVSTLTDRSSIWMRSLDVFEKIVLLIFFSYFLVPMAQAVWNYGNPGAALLTVSVTIEVALVLFRKPAQNLSQRPLDWLLAFGATMLPHSYDPPRVRPPG